MTSPESPLLLTKDHSFLKLLLLSQAPSCKYAASSLLTPDSHCQIPNLCSPHSESTLAELGTQSYHPSQSHPSTLLPKVLGIEFLNATLAPS